MKEDFEKIIHIDKPTIEKKLLARGENQEKLFELARYVRDNGIFKNRVELRSVIEISNHCRQACRYCGIGKHGSEFYILNHQEIIKRITSLASIGRRTFLLQSGEYPKQEFIEEICLACKEVSKLYSDIKLILCIGNLNDEQYKQLKNSGVKRYLLKFETSNPDLHKFCRPTDTLENRLKHIHRLIELGFQVGSGNIVGLPNQNINDLIDDLILTTKLKLSMVSATKFIPNSKSEFKNYKSGDINLTLNFIALLRILNPNCLIPSTSSLQTEDKDGQLMGLLAGCNTVTIHDGTPEEFEKNYTIYTQKRFTPSEDFCRSLIYSAKMEPEPFLI